MPARLSAFFIWALVAAGAAFWALRDGLLADNGTSRLIIDIKITSGITKFGRCQFNSSIVPCKNGAR